MAISATACALGAVAVTGFVLFAIGTPADRVPIAAADRPMPAWSAALNRNLADAAAMAGPHAAGTLAAANGVTLRSVGFDLPGGDRQFPPGAAAELVANSCTACHSPGMILTQPVLTRAEWTGEVTKMLKIYKAPVDEADVPAIVAYLAELKPGP